MRIMVTGDQGFDDYKFLAKKLDVLTLKLSKVEIAICGLKGSYLGKSILRTGAEYHATKWAGKWLNRYLVYHTQTFYQGDRKHGPERRLEQMLEECDAAVFFWNGINKQTRDLINRARKAKLNVRVFKYRED